MIRFARSPDGVVTPDIAARLPGRGVWVSAERTLVETAAQKGLFARGFKQASRLPDGQDASGFAQSIAELLQARMLQSLGLMRRAGQAAPGFEQARDLVKSGKAGFVLSTKDAAEDGVQKLQRVAKALDLPALRAFSVEEVSAALGLFGVHHLAAKQGGGADAFLRDAKRLQGFTSVFAQKTAMRTKKETEDASGQAID